MKTFKTMKMMVLALFFGSSASAIELPNCWQEGVATGSYLVSVDLDTISKDALVNLLTDANGQFVTPSYPILSPNSPDMVLPVEARPLLSGELPERILVEGEILDLMQIDGVVGVHCDGLAQPFPRMGAGN